MRAVGGSVDASCESRAWTSCSDWRMSTLQLKNRLISEEPREVFDLMRWMPGMPFIASSMGRVTETSVCGAGATAVVDNDHDAGKIGGRKDRDWQLPCSIQTRRAEQRDHYNNGA